VACHAEPFMPHSACLLAHAVGGRALPLEEAAPETT
jgi:hypothetical protein